MATPIIPTVHLNGTNGQELLDQICNATYAIRKAMEALQEAAPNGRDYYPQGQDVMRQAQDQHAARQNALRAVLTELEQIGEGISDRLV